MARAKVDEELNTRTIPELRRNNLMSLSPRLRIKFDLWKKKTGFDARSENRACTHSLNTPVEIIQIGDKCQNGGGNGSNR
jgi:hypothetical protein